MRELIVLSCAHSQTVLSESQCRRRYVPFGWCRPSATSTSLNGQWKERSGQMYLFGNGYRSYFPTLGRFGSPDKLSPFGKGGVNSYAYANQDPINYSDPTGAVPAPLFSAAKALAKGAKKSDSFLDETLNVRDIAKGIYIFDDATKRGMRLNIVGHSAIFDNPYPDQIQKKIPRILTTDRPRRMIDPDYMMDLTLAKVGDISRYRSVRTIICNSGEPIPHGLPIGKTVAIRTGLPTKSYLGLANAETPGVLRGEDPLKNRLRQNSGGGYDYAGRTFIYKNLPHRLYRPVYFDP